MADDRLQNVTKELSHILGGNVRKLRLLKGWTLEQLADKLSLNLGSVSRIELGLSFPRKSTLDALATVFGVEVEDLLARPTNELPAKNTEVALQEAQKRITELTEQVGALKYQLQIMTESRDTLDNRLKEATRLNEELSKKKS